MVDIRKDENARKILEEARATIERVENYQLPERDPHLDVMALWRRVPEPEKTERKLDVAQQDWSDWDRWCDSRIKLALQEYREFQFAVIAEVIASIQHDIIKAKKEVSKELAELRAVLQRETNNVQHLPTRKNDAA